MARAGNMKRAVGWVSLMTLAGGALLVATPSSAERPSARAPARVVAPVASPRPAAQARAMNFGRLQADRSRAPFEVEAARPVNDEPVLEPWSLIAGALSVMVFIARRRRPD